MAPISDENLHFLAVDNDHSDPDMAYLLKSRPALLEAIRKSREHYSGLLR